MSHRFLSITAIAIAILTVEGSIVSAQEAAGTSEAPVNNSATEQGTTSPQQSDGHSQPSNEAVNPNQKENAETHTQDQSTSSRSADRNAQTPSGSSQSQSSDRNNWDERQSAERSDNPDFDQNRSSRDQRNNDGYSRQNHRNDFRSGVEFGRGSDRGVTITNVERNSIYYNSGIRQNDVIVSISGRPVRNDAEFYSFIRPGSRVPVIVLRDGRRKTVYITYDQDRNRMNDGNTVYDQSTGSQAYLGVRFETRIRDAAVISAITPGSPAEEAGLQRGDELVAINGQEIRSPQEVTRLIASMQPGATVEIEFSRRSDERTQVMLQGRPEGHSTTQYQQQNVYRGGPQYDRMNRQEFDQDYSNAPANNNNKNNYGRWENGSDRRSTRPLLPRLRN